MTYFELIAMQPAFDLDLAVLEESYFKAQRQFHPDRFVNKPAEEKMSALQKSMDINAAYETLKNPLKRSQYLLSLHGIIVGTDKDSIKPSQALLMEIMELQENPLPKEEIQKLVEKSQMLVTDYYKNANFLEMAQEVLRLGYLIKMVRTQ